MGFLDFALTFVLTEEHDLLAGDFPAEFTAPSDPYGTSLRLELVAPDDTGALCESLRKLSCVGDVAIDGRDVLARVTDEAARYVVLEAIAELGLSAREVSVRTS